jgi:hypothetical protein
MCVRAIWGRGRSARFIGVISGALILAVSIGNARASELFSESVYVPPVQPSLFAADATAAFTAEAWKHFHLLLNGDPTLPTQNATDNNTDPFSVDGTSTITVTHPYVFPVDATGLWVGPGPIKLPDLTVVNFNGSTAINPANIPAQNLDNPASQVQFGLQGPTDNTPMQFVGQHWGAEPAAVEPDGPFLRMIPIVSVTPNPAPPAAPPNGQSFQFIVDFIQFTQDGISGTEWAEFPYLPGQQPTFTYSGWADPADPIHFTDTEIQLSSTLIPLDDLNFADDPLAGSTAGPAFSAQTDADDIVVAVPEPASIGLIAAAGMSLLSRRPRRKTA